MLKNIDRIFGVLLVLASLGHTFGTLTLVPAWGGIWVWSLGAALAGLLLGALNIVRASRPGDTTIAILTTAGTFCWILVALAFGKSIGHLLDPRVMGHVVISSVLVIFGLITLSRVSASELEIARVRP
jgi:hypothetical protein